MVTRSEDYSNFVHRLFNNGNLGLEVCRNVTFQVTGDCNLRCSYCYEHHKSCGAMSLETGKRIVDYIIDLYEDGTGDFINKSTQGVVLDFIGGEPLLEAELIEKITDYWFEQCWKRKCPLWARARVSFATNGQLWFSDAAQHLFHKYHEIMSVTVSIDGVQELHDAFRVDKNGVGSFEKAWAAFQDGKKYGWYNCKMTFVGPSFKFIFPSVKQMISEGCKEIHCNYAFEPVYTEQEARTLYTELQRLADYLISDAPDVWVGILDPNIGQPSHDDKNWCGGTGEMLSFAPDGKAYPCVRYAPISVGAALAEPMCLGDCYTGLYTTEKQRETKAMLDAITRTSQSPEKCLSCPVATGCGWCSGYNYESCGTPNCRNTNICLAHKARCLAVCYYINKRSLIIGDAKPKKIYLPREEAVQLIGEDATAALWTLAEEAKNNVEVKI